MAKTFSVINRPVHDRLMYSKILATHPIGYWPLWEASGGTANDLSGSGFHGTCTDVTFAQAGIGDGNTSASFNGSSSGIDIFSVGLAAAFNPVTGSLGFWGKVSGSAIWTDGNYHTVAYLYMDANNLISLSKRDTNNLLLGILKADGTAYYTTNVTTSTTGWFNYLMVWDRNATDKLTAYFNGQRYTPNTNLGTWVGSLTAATIGKSSSNYWSGGLAHVALWDKALSPAEAWRIGRI